MNNLVVFVIAGAFLCGAAVGQKGDFESCSAAADCKNKCCFNKDYCAPPVNGTCNQELLEKACNNPQKDSAKALCPVIKKVADLIPRLKDKGLVPELLGAVTKLLDGVLDLLGLIPILDPVVDALKLLLATLDKDLDRLLAGLNVLLAHLLTALLG